MKRKVFKSMTSILLVVCMLATLVPTYTYNTPQDVSPSSETGYVSDDNGYIKYYVNVATGGFYILPSVQPFDGAKAPSFGSLRLDGSDYVFGGDYPDSDLTLPPYIGEDGTCQTEWRIGDTYITQYLNIIQNDAGTNSYAVYIRYEARADSVLDANAAETSGIDASFEGRILLDTMFGPEDNMPVSVSNGDIFYTSETTLTGEMPEYYGLDVTFAQVAPRAYGLTVHESVSQPTAITFAHFDNVRDTAFDYTPVDGAAFTDTYGPMGADSAVLLYFEGQREEPKGPLCFSTIYGFDELTHIDSAVSGQAIVTTALDVPIQEGTPEITVGIGEVTGPTIVGFGGRQWSVIGYNGTGIASAANTLTLLSRSSVEATQFNTSTSGAGANGYKGSVLNQIMDKWATALPAKEQKVIEKNAELVRDGVGDARFWPLSKSEAEQVNGGTNVLRATTGWWLRTGYSTTAVYTVRSSDIAYVSCNQNGYNAVPATILNLSNVLFSSPAVGGKVVAAGDDLTAASALSGAIKLTVKDSSLTLDVTDVVVAQTSVSFNYSNATAGATLSAAVLNAEGVLRYYGKLVETIAASGSATVNLPMDIADSDKVLIFAEEINGDNSTDFCSEPYTVVLEPSFTINTGDGFLLSGTPTFSRATGMATIRIKQDTDTFEGQSPTKAVKSVTIKDSKDQALPYEMVAVAGEEAHLTDIVISFACPYDDVTLELVSTQARKVTVPEFEGVRYAFADTSVGAKNGYVIPTDAAVAGNQITLLLTAEAGVTPDSTISLMDSVTYQVIEDVETSGPADGTRIYPYHFTMPDADITLVFDTVTVELSHYPIAVYVPDGRGQITLWNGDQILEKGDADSKAEPGSTVTVKISDIDYVHTDFHGITAASYISGQPVALNTVTVEKEYTFTMPKHSVIVNLDVRQKPTFTAWAERHSDASLDLSNDRTKIASRSSVTGYIDDKISFFITNKNIAKIMTEVQVLTADADGNYTVVKEAIPVTDQYADRFTGQFTLSGQDVLLRAVLADAPPIPIEVKSDLPSGNTITASDSVGLGKPFSFRFTTADERYLLYRPVMLVYDKDDKLIYENLFDNGMTHKASSPVTYTSGEINKTGGVPAKIVLDVRQRTVTYQKALHTIAPNSTKAELFRTIDVIGLNMYKDDIGDVFFGTTPNPTTLANDYITAYGEKSLTITVPESMLPGDEDTTYYVKINDVVKSCTITVDRLLRSSPFGWLAVVSDSANNHSVIVADSEAELMALKGYGTITMKLTGSVKYNEVTNYYEFSEGPVLINNTATFTAAASDKPLRVQQTATGVTLSAAGGRMSVPGYTFVRGEDILVTLKNGTKYIDTWAKSTEGGWATTGVENVVFEYKTFGLDATIPVLKDGLTVEIRNAVLLKDTVIFGGRLKLQLTGINVKIDQKEPKKSTAKLESNRFEIDIRRLAFGNNNGSYAFKGVEGVGEIELQSLKIPGLDFSSPSGKLEVNTFQNRYAITVGMDLKVMKVNGTLTLEPLNNGWPMIDSFKAVFGIEPGIPILPVAPVGHITSGGAGFSGIVDSLNGNFDALPPFMVSIYGSFDLVKLLKMNDIRINVGASEISFSAKPKLAGIDLFEKFGGGLYITRDGVRFTVAVDAVLLKGFEVIRGGGNVEISYLNRNFRFSGTLYARLQIPAIQIGWYWHIYKWYKPWKGEWRPINIGPFTLLSAQVGINDAGAMAGVSVLGFKVKVEYKWGARLPTVSLFSAGPPDTLEVTQSLYDESGQYAGYVSYGGNLSVVAVSGPASTGISLFSARSLDEIKLTVRQFSEEEIAELREGYEDEEIPEKWDKLDYRYHTLVLPAGIENDEDDYALVIDTPSEEIRITDPSGKPFLLKYADGDLNAAGLNAVVFDGEADDEGVPVKSIMIRLPKAAGTWKLESSIPFGSSVIAIAPLPEITKAELNDNELSWAVKNLKETDSYVLEVRMAKDDGTDPANADPGILIEEIEIPAGKTADGVYTITPEKMGIFASGDYYPVLYLSSIQKGIYDSDGKLLEEGDFKVPADVKNAGAAYQHVNPDQPGDVASVALTPGGGGALNAAWTQVDKADGYIVSVYDKDGNPVYAEADPENAAENANGTEQTPIVFDIPGNNTETLDVNLGGLTPGEEYFVRVMAYRAFANSYEEDGETGSFETRLYGGAAKSNTILLPVPKFPAIFADLPGGEAQFDDMGNRILYVNGSFGFTLSADQACIFTVQQGEKNIYTSENLENAVTVSVDMTGLASTSVAILAENAAGDMSYQSFTVYLDDVPPPLFVNTDPDGSLYTDVDGNYVVTGRTESYAIVSDDLGNSTQAGEDGEFSLTGSLPVGAEDTLRSIRATDHAGNTETADILIKSFAQVAASLVGISISPSPTVSLSKGESFPVSATGLLSDGSVITIPSNAVDYHVREGAANVSVDSDTGRVTANTRGRSVIDVSIGSGDDTLTSEALVLLINEGDLPETFPVTVNSKGTGASASGSHAQGAVVNISAGTPPANMRFKNWTASPAVVFADATSPDTSFTMIGQAVTLTANFESTLVEPLPETPETPGTPVDGVLQGSINGQIVALTQSPDGTVTLVLTAEDIAKYPASKNIYVIQVKDQASLIVTFPISAMLETGAALVQIKTDHGTVTLTRKMLEAYRAAYGDVFEISVRKGSFIVELLRNGTAVGYNDPANPLMVSIPVTPEAETDPNDYVTAQIIEGGRILLPYSVYKDAEVTFLTASTGVFDAVYNSRSFTDVTGHWAADDIAFVSARSMFSGMGDGLFSPDTSMTRAMFVQVISNLEGADLSAYRTSAFTDVAETAWYAPAVAWAADNKIVTGYGNGLFGPEDTVSREQMAVMLANYIEYKGYTLPAGEATAFGDDEQIAAWARDAVRLIQGAGIVNGKPGNLYDPKGTATRGEVAAIFSRLVHVYLDHMGDTGLSDPRR